MIKINLLPAEILKNQRLQRERIYVIRGGIALVRGVALLTLLNIGLIVLSTQKNAKLKKKDESMVAIISKMEEVKQYYKMIEKNTRFSEQLLENRVDWTGILKDLFAATPKSIWYQKIYFSMPKRGKFSKVGRFDLYGYTKEEKKDIAFKLPDKLRKESDYFDRARYDGRSEDTVKFDRESEQKYLRFRIVSK